MFPLAAPMKSIGASKRGGPGQGDYARRALEARALPALAEILDSVLSLAIRRDSSRLVPTRLPSATAAEVIPFHPPPPRRKQERMIEVIGLNKDFDGKPAVIDVNLKIETGELFCFLGPNGAGKTTTFKILTGLLDPTSGTARVAGFDIQKDPVEAKRRLGYIPDRPYLYEKLSGRDFFTFVGDLFGVDRATQRERMDYYFELFLLTEARDQFIENYSHGMRQKLVFASQLMHDPEVLIVDEPMVGLDPRSMHVVKKLLREESKRGRTIFLSTHTLADVEELADRIGVISHGRLVFVGTIDELRGSLDREGRLEELFLQLTDGEVA